MAKTALRYGLAVVAVGVALALRLNVPPVAAAGTPFLLFLAAVMFAAWYGGFGPGLLATLVAVAAGNFFFIQPLYSFRLVGRDQRVAAVLFCCEGLFISGLSAQLIASRRRAEENAAAARELERQVVRTSEEERRRIGRDLHDDLGQHLTGAALAATLLNRRLAAQSLPEAEEARRLVQLVNDAVARTRDLAAGLSPLPTGPEGLCSGLTELAATVEESSAVDCEFSCHPPGSVRITDEAVAVHLYRIAQEAVSNAVRHAEASSIAISLRRHPEGVRLAVEDDGRGFPLGLRPDSGSSSPNGTDRGGMGLQTMRYRARVIGATLQWAPRPGGGTSVTCVWRSKQGKSQ